MPRTIKPEEEILEGVRAIYSQVVRPLNPPVDQGRIMRTLDAVDHRLYELHRILDESFPGWRHKQRNAWLSVNKNLYEEICAADENAHVRLELDNGSMSGPAKGMNGRQLPEGKVIEGYRVELLRASPAICELLASKGLSVEFEGIKP